MFLMDQYIKVDITVEENEQERIMAELLAIGFDSFAEHANMLEAYVEKSAFSEADLKEVLHEVNPAYTYTFAEMPNINWNEEWEKNFDPLVIANQCYVRASFHAERPEFQYEVVINPKMSFGTGHHATTSLMLEYELETDLQDKIMIDAGCGTGILSILAQKKGAKKIYAFDIEDWAFENLIENCNLNGCDRIQTGQGTITEIISAAIQVDILLANINKNVLLAEMDEYNKRLLPNGLLFLSGFYEEDITDILTRAEDAGFKKESFKVKDRWVSMKLIKK
ncbi:[LSU ribosomal protein L11P]-lysine N-methyltransferase [Cytophaga hutchinsonii ATCC 33406]|uniref:[LSU ribosomal protein L11P]-lysine N-methyltransferase n=1 Tax=Cytophaga hutchinsonii (strain ATCC 33406 / DSM 1761 / CIP 103989 / NBRC 15051 / NCIMB 9469 / D465) TaxID=269798 RepID=A0A6N4SVB2_CYTH3|nr:[LSU ribosomal protein L11P]-lysine N-methyltransferase [Cytophaga hutchinsonii ATCC 33406]